MALAELHALIGALCAILVGFWRAMGDFGARIRRADLADEVAGIIGHHPLELTPSSTG